MATGKQLTDAISKAAKARQLSVVKTTYFVPINIDALRLSLEKVLIRDWQGQENLDQIEKLNFPDLVNQFNDKVRKIVPPQVLQVADTAAIRRYIEQPDRAVAVKQGAVLLGILLSDTSQGRFVSSQLNRALREVLVEAARRVDDFISTITKPTGLDLGRPEPSELIASLKQVLSNINSKMDSGVQALGPSNLADIKKRVETRLEAVARSIDYSTKITGTISKHLTPSFEANASIELLIKNGTPGLEQALANELSSLISDAAVGTDSIEEEIREVIEELIITGKAKPRTRKKVPLPPFTGKNLVNLQVKSSSVKSVVAPKPKIEKRNQVRGVDGRFYSLAGLNGLLDKLLSLYVKKNMGKGDRRDILNLRTGRFAQSVHIVRMTQSREGMITAFYDYMRNPYATFSEGGAMQFPRTRDPKLMISSSIRELAAEQVTNRLRAVLV